MSRFQNICSTKPTPRRPVSDLSSQTSVLPFQIHMDNPTHHPSSHQGSSRKSFQELNKENPQELNRPWKKSEMTRSGPSESICIPSLPGIHAVHSDFDTHSPSLPRLPLQPIHSANGSHLEVPNYSSEPDDEFGARCEMDSAMDISTLSNATHMDDREQVLEGEIGLDVDANSDNGEDRLTEDADDEMTPVFDCHEYMSDAYEHLRSIEVSQLMKHALRRSCCQEVQGLSI